MLLWHAHEWARSRSGGRRRAAACGFLAAATWLVAGCGEDTVAPGPSGPARTGPLEVFAIGMRPSAIQRATLVPGQPVPQLAVYSLTAFHQGGIGNTVFDWTVDPLLGELGPKATGLTIHDATVFLHATDNPPLGLHEIHVRAEAGNEEVVGTTRIAVVENIWMKHARVTGPVPAALVQSPFFAPTESGDEIIYVQSPSSGTQDLKRINAFAPLSGDFQLPRDVFVAPPDLVGGQVSVAAEGAADLSPPGLGRDEILFSSQMDPQYNQRCPDIANCRETPGFGLWVVKRPQVVSFLAHHLTEDSTFVDRGIVHWYAFNYRRPRWDPSATGSRARIAFLFDGDGRNNLWLAELVDKNNDAISDTLENFEQLTTGGASSFSWHPSGEYIYYTDNGRAIRKINLSTRAVMDLNISGIATSTDTVAVEGIGGIDIFRGSTTPTWITFQGTLREESTRDLYIYNEDDRELLRVLPFAFSTTHDLFPRWHPSRREIVYVSDYSVQAWTGSLTDPTPDPAERFGTRRTRFPSMWVVRLEDI